MKKKEWLPIVIGLVVLVILAVGCLLLKQYNSNQVTEEEEEDVLFSFSDADVTDLEFVDKAGAVLHLLNQNGEWLYAEDTEHCKVATDAVQNLLTAINDLVVLEQFENVSNLADYGLEHPVNTVTLTVADEAYVLHIGNYNDTTANQYVLFQNDKDTVYAVDTSLIGVFNVDIFNLAVGENFPTLTEDSIKKAVLKKGEEEILLPSTAYSDLIAFSYNNYVEYYCSDFSKYGLDNPQMSLQLTYLVAIDDENNVDADGITGTISTEQNMTLSIGNQYTDKETGVVCYYVRTDATNEVHSIAADKIDKLISDEE